MKKLIVMAMVLVFCLVGSVQAQKKTSEVNLVDLVSRKIVTLKESPSGNGSKNFLIIEVPLSWWKKQTKATKESVVRQGIWLSKAQRRSVIHGVYVASRANKKWLAYGDPNSEKIDVE
jgi:hypothetical protein